ncbi:MAG TPA: CPBP family intramembrane glutamic endopeptidase [Anaerolineales bacterium]|nr:CPBP family intramembrane glutamic endopeptidase [Patescibacteria group bacterium]HLE50638.1 CPBP family intramembrane glutamic endopeptidase [Anaerolineales bacterium]
MKTKILTTQEILSVFVLFLVLRVSLRSTSIVQWEKQNLGWTYTVMLLFIGITTLVILLTRRSWSEYGVSSMNWQTNLDLGFKAYLVRIIPVVFGMGGAVWLGLDTNKISGGAFVALFGIIGLAVMVWVLNHHKPVKSGRTNILATLLFLLLPIGVALALGKLSLVIVSTVIWQFVFSGFGEEFMFRGYFQSRLNQAFGRPVRLFGIQFGIGLVIASLLFGLLHAFNTYDPAVGLSSLAWGWALSSFVGGLFFGVIREKTGTLVAPSIAHGLPDAVGEALIKIFGWM